jgi:hypothetical protein
MARRSDAAGVEALALGGRTLAVRLHLTAYRLGGLLPPDRSAGVTVIVTVMPELRCGIPGCDLHPDVSPRSGYCTFHEHFLSEWDHWIEFGGFNRWRRDEDLCVARDRLTDPDLDRKLRAASTP